MLVFVGLVLGGAREYRSNTGVASATLVLPSPQGEPKSEITLGPEPDAVKQNTACNAVP